MGRSPRKSDADGHKTDVVFPAGQEHQAQVKSKKGSPRKGPSVIKLKVPEAKPAFVEERRPVKLTLKLSKSAEEFEAQQKAEALAAASATRITPKLTLSLRRPSVEVKSATAVEVKVPKKRGRKAKGFLGSASVDSTSSDRTGKTKKVTESAPVSLNGSKSSLGSASATSLLQANKPQVPVYSEEDRLHRQIISEMVQQRVSRLQGHRVLWDAPVESVSSLITSLWPFYEQLAVTEVTHSGLYRQAAMTRPVEEVSPTERQTVEYEALMKRFNDLTMAERERNSKTELVVLEYRLCLEEEKFLYTKLKNEYYTKYSSMGSGNGVR